MVCAIFFDTIFLPIYFFFQQINRFCVFVLFSLFRSTWIIAKSCCSCVIFVYSFAHCFFFCLYFRVIRRHFGKCVYVCKWITRRRRYCVELKQTSFRTVVDSQYCLVLTQNFDVSKFHWTKSNYSKFSSKIIILFFFLLIHRSYWFFQIWLIFKLIRRIIQFVLFSLSEWCLTSLFHNSKHLNKSRSIQLKQNQYLLASLIGFELLSNFTIRQNYKNQAKTTILYDVFGWSRRQTSQEYGTDQLCVHNSRPKKWDWH